MEKHKHIINFYRKAANDERLLPTHLTLYLAIYYFCSRNGLENPVTIYRKDLMPLARINSIATYHKCMKDLDNFGYILYKPTYNYYKGSKIVLRIDNVST
jgi:hypothetical protein